MRTPFLAFILALLLGVSSAASASEVREALVVTATRTGSPLENLPISVSTVEKEEIQRQLRQNRNVLTAIEAEVPGLNVQDSEERGTCLTRLRGRVASFQINGVPVNEDLRQGSCTGPFTVNPFAIDRIEVVRGGSALYGAGAPGGIVNMLIRQGDTATLKADGTVQTSFNTHTPKDTFTTDVYAGLGQQGAAYDFYLGLGYTDGGRVRDSEGDPLLSNEFDAGDLVSNIGLLLPLDAELRWTTTFHEEDVDEQFYPSGRIVPGAEQLAEVIEVEAHPQVDDARDRNLITALTYSLPAFLGHSADLSVFYQDQSIKQRDNFFHVDFGGNDFFASNRENDRIGARSTLIRSYTWEQMTLKTSYGFDFTQNSFYRFIVDPAQNERITGYVSPEVELRTYAFFGQGELTFGDLTLAGGGRSEWYRGEITSHGFNPDLRQAATPGDMGESSLTLANLGAIYRITDAMEIYAGFSQGAELTQLGRAARGVRIPGTLTPEPATSDQYEIGTRGVLGSVDYGVAGYYSRSSSASLLQADPSCAGITNFCPLIPLRTPQRFHGVEANADWAASETLTLSGIFVWQRGEVFNEALGRYIDYSTDVAVPIRFTGRVEWSPLAIPLNSALQITYYGGSSYFSPAEQGLGFVDTESVALLSGSLGYRTSVGEFYLAADNLLNNDYISPNNQAAGEASFAYYRGAGRRVTLGYSVDFDL